MPDLPWTSRAELEAESRYLVMASHLPLRKLSSTFRFLRAVSAVRKQLAGANGLMSYTLRAHPIARDYWTLSVWSSESSLRQFMRTAPHVKIMKSLRPVMGPTKFVQWEIAGIDGRPSWATALARLGTPET